VSSSLFYDELRSVIKGKHKPLPDSKNAEDADPFPHLLRTFIHDTNGTFDPSAVERTWLPVNLTGTRFFLSCLFPIFMLGLTVRAPPEAPLPPAPFSLHSHATPPFSWHGTARDACLTTIFESFPCRPPLVSWPFFSSSSLFYQLHEVLRRLLVVLSSRITEGVRFVWHLGGVECGAVLLSLWPDIPRGVFDGRRSRRRPTFHTPHFPFLQVFVFQTCYPKVFFCPVFKPVLKEVFRKQALRHRPFLLLSPLLPLDFRLQFATAGPQLLPSGC